MKTLVFLSLLTLSTLNSVYAEVVNCHGSLDNAYKTPVGLIIEKSKDSMFPSSNSFLNAKVTFDYDGTKQQKLNIVRRFEKDGKIIYKDILDSSSFRLEINNSEGELSLDMNTTFKEKIQHLSCVIAGKVTGQVSTCPLSYTKDLAGEMLITAAKSGNMQTLEDLLLECEANVNFINKLGCNALMSAVDPNCGIAEYSAPQISSMYENETVELLLKKGAKLELKDPIDGSTALLKSIRNKSGWVIDQLLDAGSNINVQDKDGNTPLILSVLNSSYQQVKTLIKHELDLTLKNNEGKTAQQIAEELKLDEILELLVPEYEAITIKMNANGKCVPAMIHVMQDETVELELKANDKMLLFESKDLNISLMAMPNSSQKTLMKPSKKGNFPYSCGEHGGSNQSTGIIMVM
ncbi:MAG TPA: ankyrin repeat domain-containing protein [Bacteriovoracaceae bacterium]|nr:ankyrin repeat domain-containing protein [Bacteriovoracaceae bacterium]